MCVKVDRGEAQDWVLVSSHVNGSVCNPLTAAFFDPEDLDPAGAPLPFKGRWASLKGTQRRFSRKALVERDDREEDRQRM